MGAIQLVPTAKDWYGLPPQVKTTREILFETTISKYILKYVQID